MRGHLFAFGRGPYATDAQHVSVEFVHPVILGKRALPAMDLSTLVSPWMEAILRPKDMVMGFGPPEGNPEVWAALCEARRRGATTFALPGPESLPGNLGRCLSLTTTKIKTRTIRDEASSFIPCSAVSR